MKSQSEKARKGTPSRGNAIFSYVLVAVCVWILAVECATAQSFAVRNPNHQAWPKAEADKIYNFATRLVAEEFKPRQGVHPQFTLVLGYEKDQMDVNTNELRLRKWDRRMFTEGVILFGFEQMMPASTKLKLLERALKESDSVVTVDEARASGCGGTFKSGACVQSAPDKP
jgi:hypothetical protein